MGKDQYFLRNLCSNFGSFHRKLPSLWGVQDGAFRRGSGEAGTFTSRIFVEEGDGLALVDACMHSLIIQSKYACKRLSLS